ncbi:MAG TPA: chromate resistance protein ChrB domain-containing protein [Burkholderiales bacterium]|nr:chromate resistance protein ChrB domain-containing protein [Burkholderiales bacterium]
MFNALVLSLPTRNSTLRMRMWRALKDSGAAVLRDGVYLLPRDAAEAGTLQRLQKEIRTHGGFAIVFDATPQAEDDLVALRARFDRTAEYATLVGRISAAKASLGALGPRRGLTALRRLEQALDKLGRIDFFPGEAKAQSAAALAALKARYGELYARNEPRSSMKGLRPLERSRYQRRVWATRKAPWVDRLASAWLIKRFIDRDAKFAWIARPSECPRKAVGFDYDGAEFTHVKNRVTFEVLAAAFELDRDPALAQIAAAVHFLDVGGIPVPDATGLETMLKGAKEKARGNDALLAEAMRTFDLLYSAYRANYSGMTPSA